MSPPHGEVTRELGSLQLGDEKAAVRIYELVYGELRGLANVCARPGSQTLSPTALVHEAWIKLDGKLEGVKNRGHFLSLAGLAMRQILADHARAERAAKRAARRVTITLSVPGTQGGPELIDLLALDEALTRLAELQERHARVVELRFLAGLTIAETAEALGVSHTTVESDWATARAWLRTELDLGD